MTTSQIDAENTQMTNDLYRLLKKYSGLRNLIRQLKVGIGTDPFISFLLVCSDWSTFLPRRWKMVVFVIRGKMSDLQKLKPSYLIKNYFSTN